MFGHLTIVRREKKKGKHSMELFYDWYDAIQCCYILYCCMLSVGACRECGTVYVFWALHMPIVIVSGPTDVKVSVLVVPGIVMASVMKLV